MRAKFRGNTLIAVGYRIPRKLCTRYCFLWFVAGIILCMRRANERRRLRDWSRSGGSYGNNTRVICCPAGTSLELRSRDVPAPDNKSLGCCCRNSLPTVVNPDYKITTKITTKSSDVAYLPLLWRHASLLNDGSCSFTHPVVKDRSARGTSSGT